MTVHSTDPIDLTRKIIQREGLGDWLAEFPWLTGFLGDPTSPIWFIAENPSLRGIQIVDGQAPIVSPNLQWTCEPGTSSRLLRDAITAAGLKLGDPCEDTGWRCYITNADKEPQAVGSRNKGKDSGFMKRQAARWAPVLQAEIDRGSPRVLVALGAQAETLLREMRRGGLRAPQVVKIHHYSYVWLRPESGTKRGPRHPARIAEFMESIAEIASLWLRKSLDSQ